MHENTANPYTRIAQNQAAFLGRFMENAKKETFSFRPARNAQPLNQARDIVFGHSKSLDFLETSYKLYQALLGKGAGNLEAKSFLFSTGIDFALRSVPGPFLIAAAELMKKLMYSQRLDELAEMVGEIFSPPGDAVEGLVKYFRKTTLCGWLPENILKRNLRFIPRQRKELGRAEIEAYEEALQRSDHSEEEIPGCLLALGYLTGQMARDFLLRNPYG